MQTDTVKKINVRVRMLSPEQQQEVLQFVENLSPEKRTPWQLWQDHLKNIPQEELDQIPTDAAKNLDHYLYCAPKKPAKGLPIS